MDKKFKFDIDIFPGQQPELDAPNEQNTVEALRSRIAQGNLFAQEGVLPRTLNPDSQVRSIERDVGNALLAKVKIPSGQGDKLGLPTVDTAFLQEMGLQPVRTVVLNGREVHLSKPFTLADGRLGVISYMEVDGHLVPRPMYRSNSRGVWQIPPATGKINDSGESVPFFLHKGQTGDGKYATMAPIEVQMQLSQME